MSVDKNNALTPVVDELPQKQQIFTPNALMKKLKEYEPLIQVAYLFYYRDEIHLVEKQGDWDNEIIRTVYFHPNAIYIQKNNTKYVFSMSILNSLLGDDFGVKFTCSKKRKIITSYPVNMLEISGEEKQFTKDNETIKYYDYRTLLSSQFKKFMEELDHGKKFELKYE